MPLNKADLENMDPQSRNAFEAVIELLDATSKRLDAMEKTAPNGELEQAKERFNASAAALIARSDDDISALGSVIEFMDAI